MARKKKFSSMKKSYIIKKISKGKSLLCISKILKKITESSRKYAIRERNEEKKSQPHRTVANIEIEVIRRFHTNVILLHY